MIEGPCLRKFVNSSDDKLRGAAPIAGLGVSAPKSSSPPTRSPLSKFYDFDNCSLLNYKRKAKKTFNLFCSVCSGFWTFPLTSLHNLIWVKYVSANLNLRPRSFSTTEDHRQSVGFSNLHLLTLPMVITSGSGDPSCIEASSRTPKWLTRIPLWKKWKTHASFPGPVRK